MLKINPDEYPGNIAAVLTPRNCQEGTIKLLFQIVSPIGTCYVTTPPFQLSLDERGFFFTMMAPLSGAIDSAGLVKWLEERKLVNKDGIFDEASLIGMPVMANVEVHSNTLKNGSRFRSQQVTYIKAAPDNYKLDPTWRIPSSFGDPRYDIQYAECLEVDEPMNGANDEYNYPDEQV